MKAVNRQSLREKTGHGSTLIHRTDNGADGTPVKAKMNGLMKTYKRCKCWFQPMKYGLYCHFYIGFTENSHDHGKYAVQQHPGDWVIPENGEEWEKRDAKTDKKA